MFSELVLLGIFCILTEFKRSKDEKDNFDSSWDDFVFGS